ncbi:helix-turn-helix domain-containing protein [Peptoniphilus sp. SGI.035]|uniref:AraC family transcriptional regulator n=1 Tax=Peptoniphilus sp. SGI.035 TaxID=3420564 RepID=UPI003D05AFBD
MQELNFSYEKEIGNEIYKIKCYAYYVGAFNYNWHEDVECLVVLNGKLEACLNGEIYNLSRGDIVFFDSKEGHATLAKEKETIALVLHFSPKILDGFDKNRERYYWKGATDKDSRDNNFAIEIRKSLVEIIESFYDNSLESKIKRSIATEKIILESIENFATKGEVNKEDTVNLEKDNAIKKIIHYLDENYREKISLNDIADLVGYHPNYTSEIFSNSVGIPFTEYLQRKRLSEATKDLKQSDKKISEIALDYGFSNVRSFNTAFRESFGRSPSRYREGLDRKTIEIDAQFKKVFLSLDNKYWLRAKEEFTSENKKPEKDKANVNYLEIEKKVYKDIIDDLEQKLNKL